MVGAEWMRWVYAGMFAALALYYLIRLLASGPAASRWGVEGSRGVMSLGMAAMLVPQLDPLPRLGWQVLFCLIAGYVAVRLLWRSGHHELHLVVGGLAMVYMLAVMPAGHELSHGTSSALPVLTWALVAYFVVFVVRLAARLAVPVDTVAAMPPGSAVVSPQLLGSSEVVMGIGMSYMLITML
jgi:Domain of unknown function (DUF5134)